MIYPPVSEGSVGGQSLHDEGVSEPVQHRRAAGSAAELHRAGHPESLQHAHGRRLSAALSLGVAHLPAQEEGLAAQGTNDSRFHWAFDFIYSYHRKHLLF